MTEPIRASTWRVVAALSTTVSQAITSGQVYAITANNGGATLEIQLRDLTGGAVTPIDWGSRLGPFIFKALDSQNFVNVTFSAGDLTLCILDG